MQDNLRWVAQYNDGTQLKQVNDDGTKNGYSDIDRAKLSAFMLFKDDQPFFGVSFDAGDGGKLIWRRRVQMRPGGEQIIAHVIGKKHQFVALVRDDLVLTFDNFSEDDALLAMPQLMEGEDGYEG